jgi:hypothetical protein
MKSTILLAATASLLLLTQCNFQKIGRDTGKGFDENTKSIASNLIAGVNKGLRDSAFKQNIYHLVDSVVSTAGGSANKSVRLLLDSLLSDRLIRYTAQMVEEATGKKLRGNLDLITKDLQLSMNNMLGAETRERVRLLVATAMDEVTGDKLQRTVARLREEMTGLQLRNNLAALRDSLLNDKTNAAIKAIVDTAMVAIAFRMKNDVNPALQDNLSFVQRNATTLLIVLGIVALVIVIVIWRLKQKYAKMTTVLASQIYAIPDQQAYDQLTYNIKEKATIAGVEPALREVLAKNGLLGTESRESWQAKKMVLLKNKN